MRNLAGALSLLALAHLGAAHSECLSLTTKFPDCALSCVIKAASKVGCTNSKDLACQCTPASSEAILATAQKCVVGCGDEQIMPASSAGKSICNCVATATATPESTASTSLPSTNAPQVATRTSRWLNSSSETPLITASAPGSGASTLNPTSSASGSSDSACSGSSCSEGKPSKGTETSASGTSTHSSVGTVITETTMSTETECLSPSPVPTNSCVPGAKADCTPVASSAIPSCAQQCFLSAVLHISCAVDDYVCQCQAQQSLSMVLAPCVAKACSASVVQSVIAGVSRVCQCASATLTDCGPQPIKPAESSSHTGGQGECTAYSCKEQPTGKPKPPQPDCTHTSCKEKPTGQPKPPPECAHESCKEQPTGHPKPPQPPQPSCTHESCKEQPTGQPKPPQPSECTHDSCKEQPTGGRTGSSQPPEQTPTGKPEESKSTPTQPAGQPTAPAVVPGSAGRFEMSLVACIITVFWMIAVALRELEYGINGMVT